MLKEEHPCSKSFARQMNATTQYALGILWVILDRRCLFQGMLPHQETLGTAGRSTEIAVYRSCLSLASRLAMGADVSFFGGLLLLIYFYY